MGLNEFTKGYLPLNSKEYQKLCFQDLFLFVHLRYDWSTSNRFQFSNLYQNTTNSP